jgi:hypothetical protein
MQILLLVIIFFSIAKYVSFCKKKGIFTRIKNKNICLHGVKGKKSCIFVWIIVEGTYLHVPVKGDGAGRKGVGKVGVNGVPGSTGGLLPP